MAPQADMLAAVYRGRGDVRVERLPVPEPRAGEVLLRVAACGVCGTDLKKVALGLVPPPRVFGHETAGVVAAVGAGVSAWREGDRAAVYHHVNDPDSWYSRRGLHAQCPGYKKTGATAGFEPAGGGFAEYVRVLPWIVERGGLVRVPEDASLEEAVFVEPVNTCLKGVRSLHVEAGDLALVTGAGSIGLILAQLLGREGATVFVSDPLPGRRERALRLGARRALDPAKEDVTAACRGATDGRGADHAVVAATGAPPIRDGLAATRPGGNVVLFAQTHLGEEVSIDVGDLCVGEKRLFGSYSSSFDVADEAAGIVFDREIELADLISHRLPLSQAPEAFRTAGTPGDEVCKVLVVP